MNFLDLEAMLSERGSWYCTCSVLTYDLMLLTGSYLRLCVTEPTNVGGGTTYVFLLYLHNNCFTYALRLPQPGGTTEECTQTNNKILASSPVTTFY